MRKQQRIWQEEHLNSATLPSLAAVQPSSGVVDLRFYLEDNLQELYQKVQILNLKITQPYIQKDYGLDEFYIEDPDGYVMRFCSSSK